MKFKRRFCEHKYEEVGNKQCTHTSYGGQQITYKVNLAICPKCGARTTFGDVLSLLTDAQQSFCALWLKREIDLKPKK